MHWFRKSKCEQLKAKYAKLMRKAYKIAPKNKVKSDQLNRQALALKKQIQQLELQS